MPPPRLTGAGFLRQYGRKMGALNMADKAPSGHITVIGAGLVGASTALSLRRAGYAVTLIERGEPGMGSSYGNAGLLSVSGSIPIATPGILWKVPKLLLDPLAPLTIRWSYLPKIAPWLLQFIQASSPGRVQEISKVLAGMLALGQDSYRALLGDDDFAALTQAAGMLMVYETDQSFEGAKWKLELRRSHGVQIDYVPAEQIRQLEPALSPIYRHAVHVPGTRHVKNPLDLTQAITRKFTEAGGEIVSDEVQSVDTSQGAPIVVGKTGKRKTDRLVIAAGAWSRELARQAGARVPLDTERGYHAMFKNPKVAPRKSIMSGDYDFAATPMAQGLRIAGTVELGGLEAAPNYARAEILKQHGKRMFDGLDGSDVDVWMGFRPSMPDSLPVIGPVPGNDRVYLAFGHGHLGVTFGAITGRLITDMIAGRKPPIDTTPLRADRF